MERQTSTLLILAAILLPVMIQGRASGYPNTLCSPGSPAYHNHPDDCGKFYQCANGMAVEHQCPPGLVFSSTVNVCVHPLSPEDKCTSADDDRDCDNGFEGLIPHPTACTRYYNCSDKSPRGMYSSFARYENECDHPDLFDVNLRKCVGYEKAVCGHGRIEIKWKCDYLANQCPKSHCIPCHIHNPSCLGKEDGVWPHSVKPWTPYFTTCVSERSENGQELCPPEALFGLHQFFHPEERRCLPRWFIPQEHGGMKPVCESERPAIYLLDKSLFLAYRCPGEDIFVCPFVLWENADISRCTLLQPNNTRTWQDISPK